MSGIGNDVVALLAIDVDRTIQYRFYSKIIVDSEKLIYDQSLASSLPFEYFVWLAWSIKESAYKCLQRYQHDLVFSPSNTLISEVNLPGIFHATPSEGIGFDGAPVCKAKVNIGHHQFYAITVLNKEFIFSIVSNNNNFADTYWGIKKIGSAEREDQSLEVRNLLFQKLHDLYPADQFRIEKSIFGFPVLLRNGTDSDIPVSFAHHDHFVGYAFVLGS